MVQLDKTEKTMILLLQRDGRMSFVDMAKEIGVTEGTIRRKFNRLVSDGIVHIAAVADPFKVGFQTLVSMMIKVNPARLVDVTEAVSGLPQIHYAAICTGPWDLMVMGNFASNEDLTRFLLDTLSKIPGVKEISTSLILGVSKNSFTWGVVGARATEQNGDESLAGETA